MKQPVLLLCIGISCIGTSARLSYMRIDSSRIPELDGLRGIAILAVIFFHAALVSPLPWNHLHSFLLFGWSGVDLFFVLSGFLIGGILMDNRGADNYFGAFYARRVFRIFPIYFLVIGTYGILWAIGGEVRATVATVGPPMSWWAYTFFSNNLWIAWHDTMFVFNSPTWSLAIEEQFYLTLPLLIWLLNPKYVKYVVVGVIVAVLGLRTGLVLAGQLTQNQAYVLPFLRFDALMIGVGCALIMRTEKAINWLKQNVWVLYAGLVVFGALIIDSGGKLPQVAAGPISKVMTYGLTVIALFYACLMMLAITRPGHAIGAVLRLQPLRYLGKLSYCIYLIHQIALLTAYSLLPDGFKSSMPQMWAATLAACVVIVIFAQLSWKLLESRMLKVGHRFKYHRGKKAVGEVATVTAMVAPARTELSESA